MARAATILPPPPLEPVPMPRTAPPPPPTQTVTRSTAKTWAPPKPRKAGA